MSGIPVLHVEADCIARGWEASLLALYRNGCDIRTQYDKEGHRPSKDATMILTITDPLREPMIHKDFPGGPVQLEEYAMEVCDGIKDHMIRNPNDPDDTRWEYTYHRRLAAYDPPGLAPLDQVETMCRKLAEVPYTRRAQAVTWKAWEDNDCFDPPCLQSLWARVTVDDGARLRHADRTAGPDGDGIRGRNGDGGGCGGDRGDERRALLQFHAGSPDPLVGRPSQPVGATVSATLRPDPSIAGHVADHFLPFAPLVHGVHFSHGIHAGSMFAATRTRGTMTDPRNDRDHDPKDDAAENPGGTQPTEQDVDQELEETFPASDPPANY